MLNLPVELRRLCLDHLENDKGALQAVRLVNHELGSIAAELLFHTREIYHGHDSADKFLSFFRSGLQPLARRVVITHFWCPGSSVHDGDCIEDILDTFEASILACGELENLEEVKLVFEEQCSSTYPPGVDMQQTIPFRTAILREVFQALKHSEKLESLSIRNLQDDMPMEIFESEEFVAVRRKIKKLHLQITSEDDGGYDPQYQTWLPVIHRGFGKDLPNIWLKPMTSQLTHLSLHSTVMDWGVVPLVDFGDIPHFSCLKSLSLRNFNIAFDWQIEWILSHSSTLQRLDMIDCAIFAFLRIPLEHFDPALSGFRPAVDTDPYKHWQDPSCVRQVDLRWHLVFDRLRAGLACLRSFTFRHDESLSDGRLDETDPTVFELSPERYLVFIGDCYERYEQLSGQEEKNTVSDGGDNKELAEYRHSKYVEEDGAAFEALLKVVRERAVS